VAEDETVAAAPDRSTAAAPAAAADEATAISPAGAEDDTGAAAADEATATSPPTAQDEPAVAAAASDDGDEKTQVIKVPVAGRPTPDLGRRPGGRPTHDFDRTQVIVPGERTQVIPVGRGEETQVIKPPDRRKQPTGGEATQIIKLPEQHKRPADGERTQIIKLPDQRNQRMVGDQTQVIRIPTPTVEPPGDRTQVLRFPAESPPSEAVTVRREPPKSPSIVGEERPNPGDDPTTRIVPPDRAARLGQDPGDETTVDVGGGKRIMTVMNLERPADEAADDTRRLVRPPSPAERRPDDDI
jgi:hypothetical protein